jgi:hypothetical protein
VLEGVLWRRMVLKMRAGNSLLFLTPKGILS